MEHDTGVGEVIVHHPAPEGEFERRRADDAIHDERGMVHVRGEQDGWAGTEGRAPVRIEGDLDVAVRVLAADEARLAFEPGVDLRDDSVLLPGGGGCGGDIEQKGPGRGVEGRGRCLAGRGRFVVWCHTEA